MGSFLNPNLFKRATWYMLSQRVKNQALTEEPSFNVNMHDLGKIHYFFE